MVYWFRQPVENEKDECRKACPSSSAEADWRDPRTGHRVRLKQSGQEMTTKPNPLNKQWKPNPFSFWTFPSRYLRGQEIPQQQGKSVSQSNKEINDMYLINQINYLKLS